jgi:hypothetical protein
MAEGWQPLDTMPVDGRRVALTRSVDDKGDPVQPPVTNDLVQVYGWMGVDGVCIIEQVISGEPEEPFQPTHWYPDPTYDNPSS